MQSYRQIQAFNWFINNAGLEGFNSGCKLCSVNEEVTVNAMS